MLKGMESAFVSRGPLRTMRDKGALETGPSLHNLVRRPYPPGGAIGQFLRAITPTAPSHEQNIPRSHFEQTGRKFYEGRTENVKASHE